MMDSQTLGVSMSRLIALLLFLALSTSAIAGAWGEGSFENDDALDWTGECSQSIGTKLVATTLNAAVKARYLEAPEASAAVAAAEVVAAARGKPSAKLPKQLSAWLDRQSKAELASLASIARQALRKVRDPKSSELKQLWSEGKKNGWDSNVGELEARLAN